MNNTNCVTLIRDISRYNHEQSNPIEHVLFILKKKIFNMQICLSLRVEKCRYHTRVFVFVSITLWRVQKKMFPELFFGNVLTFQPQWNHFLPFEGHSCHYCCIIRLTLLWLNDCNIMYYQKLHFSESYKNSKYCKVYHSCTLAHINWFVSVFLISSWSIRHILFNLIPHKSSFVRHFPVIHCIWKEKSFYH